MSIRHAYIVASVALVLAVGVALFAGTDRRRNDQITAVDLAVLLGEHEDAKKRGDDGLKEFVAKWGDRRLLVHGYVLSVGPWGYYELGTTPDSKTATTAMFSPGNEFLKADIPLRSYVSAQCRSVTLFPHYIMFTDTVFVTIDRPELKIVKSKD